MVGSRRRENRVSNDRLRCWPFPLPALCALLSDVFASYFLSLSLSPTSFFTAEAPLPSLRRRLQSQNRRQNRSQRDTTFVPPRRRANHRQPGTNKDATVQILAIKPTKRWIIRPFRSRKFRNSLFLITRCSNDLPRISTRAFSLLRESLLLPCRRIIVVIFYLVSRTRLVLNPRKLPDKLPG